MRVRPKDLTSIREERPAETTPAKAVVQPDAPRVELPSVARRNFADARAVFSQLFKRNAPTLRLKDSITTLSESEQARHLIEFTKASGLHAPREIHEARAAFAERNAVHADSIPEKKIWLRLALDSWVAASRFERPTKTGGVQLKAIKTAELLASINRRKGHRLFWEATATILKGEPKGAKPLLKEARRLTLDDDIRASVNELLGSLDVIERELDVKKLVNRLGKPNRTLKQLSKIRSRASALAEVHPRQSLRLAAIEIEVCAQIEAKGGPALALAEKIKLIEGAAKRTIRLADKRGEGFAVASLQNERDLLLARAYVGAGEAAKAHPLLARVEGYGDQSHIDQARLLRAEVDLSRGDTRGVSALEKEISGLERKALLASLAAGGPHPAPDALARIDTLIDELSDRGTAATYRSGATSMVQTRIQTSSKSMVVPQPTLTADEAYALSELLTTRALLLVRTGQPDAALETLADRQGSALPDRMRFARAIAALASGDVAQATRDLAWVRQHARGTEVEILEADPRLRRLAEGDVSDLDPKLAREAADAYLQGVQKRGFAALSTYPLAAAAGIPLRWLMEGGAQKVSLGPTGTRGTYEAHVGLVSSATPGFDHDGETATCAALRQPSLDTPITGMLLDLIGRKNFRMSPTALIDRALGREAVERAIENLSLSSSAVPELSDFVAEALSFNDHARGLALAVTLPGTVAQTTELLRRHDVPMEPDAEVPQLADDLLHSLNEVMDAGGLQNSKKAFRTKDKKGVLAPVWEEVAAAVATEPSRSLKTLAEAEIAITRLGFAKSGPHLYQRGDAVVQLTPANVGEAGGYQLELGKLTDDGFFRQYQRSVHIDGLTFQGEHWKIFEKGYDRTLRRYAAAVRRTVGSNRGWRNDIKGVRALIGLGRQFGVKTKTTDGKVAAKKFEMGMELHTLGRQCIDHIAEMKRKGIEPKGVMIMVDGIDAASKTSNGEAMMEFFTKNGFRGKWKSFKAPTKTERRQHWLRRYKKHEPKEGQVFMCDRSPLGDVAYNESVTPEDMERMAKEFRAWQEEMEAKGILVLNLLFYPGKAEKSSKRSHRASKQEVPDLWRPMFTFGKREGRAIAAQEMAMRAKVAGAPKQVRRGLEQAAELHPGINDLRSFHNGVQVHERFRAFAEAIGTWKIIPTERRHKGRKQARKWLLDRLHQHETASR